jgi:hypothetical protein
MANLFVRPSVHLTSSNVLSASSESGITLEQPVEVTHNGRVNLEASGTVTAVTALNFRLASPGNPIGYSADDGATGMGCGLLWKTQAEGSTAWKGYTDTRFLTRLIPWRTAVSLGTSPSVQLASGALLVGHTTTTTILIQSLSTLYVATTLTTLTDSYAAAAGTSYRLIDFCRLPNDRILALYLTSNTVNSKYVYTTLYSDDEGVTWTTLASRSKLSATAFTHVNLLAVGETVMAVVSEATGAAGGGEVWVSNDGGYSFVTTDSKSNWKRVRACVTPSQTVVIVSLSISASVTAANTYRTSTVGTLSDLVLAPIGDDDSTAIGCVCRDDGTVWLFTWGRASTNNVLDGAVSFDDGATWSQVPTGAEIANHQAVVGNAYKFISMDCGLWNGQVVAGLVDATNGRPFWLEFGGWSRLTEEPSDATYTSAYYPTTTPDNVGWTKTDTGAGFASVTALHTLNMVSSVAGNSYYQAPVAWWSATTDYHYRIRFAVRVNSGGSTTLDQATIAGVQTDGANSQGFKFRFSSTGYRLVDQAGNTLVTVTTSMTSYQEFLVILRYDHSANTGALRVWRRALFTRCDTAWTEDLAATTFAESAGAAQVFRIGGTDIAAAVDWDLAYLLVAQGSGGLYTQVNPSDLTGRPLTDGLAFRVTDQVNIRGFGNQGSKADTWTLDTGYQYPKANLWRNQRPSCTWRSTADNASTNLVFDAGTNNLFRGQIAALFGINFRTATLQFNATDAWGAPSATLALDGTIVSGVVSASVGRGFIGFTITSGFTMVPHMFKSSEGQRFFAEIGGQGYLIDDNSATVLYIQDVDFTAAAGTVYVYSDRLAADYGSVIGYRFMRLLIGAQQTYDNDYRAGYLLWNEQHAISTLYDRGFTDEWTDSLEVTETDGGAQFVGIRGPRRRRLMVRWNNLNRLLSSYEEANLHFFASLRGEAFAHWRNTSDPSSVTLYRLADPTVARENTLGELATAVSSRGQLTFEEVI